MAQGEAECYIGLETTSYSTLVPIMKILVPCVVGLKPTSFRILIYQYLTVSIMTKMCELKRILVKW